MTEKSSTNKFNSGVKYVIDIVQSIFGINLKEIFILMCTNCDTSFPNAIPNALGLL